MSEHHVRIATVGGATVTDLPCRLGTSCRYSRALSDVSTATVTAHPHAFGSHPLIQPWIHWAHIYRDGTHAWSGPVTTRQVTRQSVTIAARDPAHYLWATRTPLSKAWAATDPALIAADLWAATIGHHQLTVPPARIIPTGLAYDFETTLDGRMAHQVLDDLVALGLDWTCLSGQMLLMPTIRGAEMTLPTARLSDCHFSTGIEVIHDGAALATDVRVQGRNWAETATADAGGLRLQDLLSIDNLSGQASIAAAAAQAVARRATPRVMLRVPPGSELSPSAPLRHDQLVPGIVMPVHTSLDGGRTDWLRLEHTETIADERGERITVTLGESPTHATMQEA